MRELETRHHAAADCRRTHDSPIAESDVYRPHPASSTREGPRASMLGRPVGPYSVLRKRSGAEQPWSFRSTIGAGSSPFAPATTLARRQAETGPCHADVLDPQ